MITLAVWLCVLIDLYTWMPRWLLWPRMPVCSLDCSANHVLSWISQTWLWFSMQWFFQYYWRLRSQWSATLALMGGKAVKSILQSWFKNFTFPYPRIARNNHCSGKTTFCHCIVLFPEEQGAKWKEGRMQEEQYSPFLIGTLKAGAKLWMSSLTTLTIMHTTLDYPLSPLENVAAACMLLTVTANKPCLCFTHHVGCWFIPIHSWKCLFWLLKP